MRRYLAGSKSGQVDALFTRMHKADNTW